MLMGYGCDPGYLRIHLPTGYISIAIPEHEASTTHVGFHNITNLDNLGTQPGYSSGYSSKK
jgi:hypothetical protein